MAKELDVTKAFEAIARIISQREEGVKVTLVSVERKENPETEQAG